MNDNEKILELKKKLSKTKKQRKRQVILEQYTGQFETKEGNARFIALKEKVYQKPIKLYSITKVIGWSSLLAFMLFWIIGFTCFDYLKAYIDSFIGLLLGCWWSLGFPIWIVLKMILVIHKRSKKSHLYINDI